MPLEYQILIALAVDQLLGDPSWLPHPVRLLGYIFSRLERISGSFIGHGYTAGALTVLLTLTISAAICSSLLFAGNLLHPLLGTAISIYLIYSSLAVKDLSRHGMAVFRPLKNNDLAEARLKVSMIVGRETAALDEKGVARAAIESVAESMVDGVTAPIFFAFLLGPIGAIVYRAVNTADSMFGYRNEKYRKFGWAAAKLDDLCNFIPARITGLITPVAALLLGYDWKNSWRIFFRDRRNHLSPNSAHTEAAVAGALNIKLGGTNIYFGKKTAKPEIGDDTNKISAEHILQANRLMNMTTLLFYLILTGALQGVQVLAQTIFLPIFLAT